MFAPAPNSHQLACHQHECLNYPGLGSRPYCDKKIAQGKHHTQPLLCLARRRADVFFAMLRDGTFYGPQPAPYGLTKPIEAPPRGRCGTRHVAGDGTGTGRTWGTFRNGPNCPFRASQVSGVLLSDNDRPRQPLG